MAVALSVSLENNACVSAPSVRASAAFISALFHAVRGDVLGFTFNGVAPRLSLMSHMGRYVLSSPSSKGKPSDVRLSVEREGGKKKSHVVDKPSVYYDQFFV